MKIYESEFQTIYYNADYQLIQFLWTEKSANLEVDNYKSEIEEQVSFIEQYRPQRLYADTLNFDYTIAPDLQEWNAELLFPKIVDLGARCWSILVSKDLFSMVSIEQTMEEKDTEGAFTTKYFEDENEALDWVKNFN